MTKGTKAFRIIISILLGLTILFGAYMSAAFIYFGKTFIHTDAYDIYVAGVQVTRENQDDILGDGAVSYDAFNNVLAFENAVIEDDYVIVYSLIDLKIKLIGENKFICNGNDANIAVYASDGILRKDLSFEGDGSLAIEFKNVDIDSAGIIAEDLWIGADITVTTPDCEEISNGLVCTASLTLRNKATVTVNNGAARSSTAVSVRGNVIIESGSAMNVTVNSGAAEACNGLLVCGNMSIGRDVTLNVSVYDATAETSDCINVFGSMCIGRGSEITAVSEKKCGVECYGAVVNYGLINAEIEALGGVHNKTID